MASKNFVVKNGLEFGNSTSNVVMASNSTQISMKFGNTTSNGILLGHTFQFNSPNTITFISDGGFGTWGNSTSPLTPNVNMRVQNVSFSNSTLTSYYGRDQWAIGSGVGGNTTALRTGTNIMSDGQVSVGGNVVLSNTQLFVGNSTINAIITSGQISVGANIAVNTSTILIGNTTVYNLMDLTKYSVQDPSANKLNMTGNSIQFTSAGSISVGSVSMNNTNFDIGANVTINTSIILLGNSTVNTFISPSECSTFTTGVGFASLAINKLTVSDFTNTANVEPTRFSVSNSTYNASLNLSTGLLIGSNVTPATSNVVGISCRTEGILHVSANSTTTPVQVNRHGGGQLIHLREDATLAGIISVAAGVVTYGTFNGSHWSQLKSGKKPKILRGTVIEYINSMCEWPGEENHCLPKFKISDTKKSKNVYGVFFAWDKEEDSPTTNDALISSLGTYVIRIGKDVKVEQGDLLQSAGDGTAEPQEDDIIRSITIGKVTSNIAMETYKDGSYLVPCVLYCG